MKEEGAGSIVGKDHALNDENKYLRGYQFECCMSEISWFKQPYMFDPIRPSSHEAILDNLNFQASSLSWKAHWSVWLSLSLWAYKLYSKEISQ